MVARYLWQDEAAVSAGGQPRTGSQAGQSVIESHATEETVDKDAADENKAMVTADGQPRTAGGQQRFRRRLAQRRTPARRKAAAPDIKEADSQRSKERPD